MNKVLSPSKIIKTDEDYNGDQIKQNPVNHKKKPSAYSINKNSFQEQTDPMFPKVQAQRLKSSAAFNRQGTGSKQALYRSIESNQKKSQQFDFSNIPKVGSSTSQSSVFPQDSRAISALQKVRFQKGSTSLDQRRGFQFSQLPTIQSVILGRQPGPNQIKRQIIDVMRKLQVEFDLQVVSRQLYINQQKIVQVMMMVSPPIRHKNDIQMNYNCIQSKLYKLMMKSIIDMKHFDNSSEEMDPNFIQFKMRVLYVIELERFSQILQFLSVPVNLGSLMVLMQIIGCVGYDLECGIVINYAKLLWFIRVVIRQQQQSMDIYQNLSSTSAQTNSEYDDTSSDGQFLIDKVGQIPRFSKTLQRKRVQFKIKRLGYIGKVTEFYDSYADLIKIVGNESNAKNYNFYGIRYSYVDLKKYQSIAFQDPDVNRETKVFGLDERSQLPIWLQAVYKHRVHPEQEVALTKVYYYLYKEAHIENTTVVNQNEIIQIRKLLVSTSLGNDMSQCKISLNYPKKSTQNLDSKDIIYKPFFKEETENGGVDFFKSFDTEISNITPNEYQFYLQTEIASDQSDIENDFEHELTEKPLFIKRIQSYPQLISERLYKLSFSIIDNYSYCKIFDNEEYMGQKSQIQEFKIKSAFQQKENFVIQPKADDGKFQRHLTKIPDLIVDSDESDRELFEKPIDATGDTTPQKSIQTQTKQLSFLKSESSSVTGIEDQSKSLQQGAYTKLIHQLEELQAQTIQETQSCLKKRFLQHIKNDFCNSEITLDVNIKNFNPNGDAPIILKTLQNIDNIKAMNSFKANYIESEEEASFDELPIEVKVPESTVYVEEESGLHSRLFMDYDQESNIDPGQCCENIADIIDLPITLERGINDVTISVKNGLVSSIEANGENSWKMNFFLGEIQRKTEAETHIITMQGKQVKSIQINVMQRGNKIFMQSFCFLATVDQKIEEEQQKANKLKEKQLKKVKQFQDDNEDNNIIKESEEELYINEIISQVNLVQKWFQGQFMIHIFYGRETEKIEDFNQNLVWLRQLLQRNFPEIIIVENDFEIEDPECFEVYIYGVGPVSKRDGNNRLMLYKKESSSEWLQNFQQKSLVIIDIICVIISLYGNAQSMSLAQAKFLCEHLSKNSRSLLQRNNQYAYKYLEGIQERLITRPITGTFRPKSSVKLNLRYQQF